MKTSFIGLSLLMATNVLATPFNGYIVKMKNPNAFLSSKSLKNYGVVSKLTNTSFGSFVKLETAKGLSDLSFNKLSQDPNIEYIEPNYIITIDKSVSTPTDSAFKKQWGLKNNSKKGEDINVLPAWDITKGGAEVKIAVIDTGVDYTHPDLKNQIDINQAELNGKPGVDDDGNGFVDDVYGYNFSSKIANPMDGHGHGTHCAGVIGASHDANGIAGVMANVKIIPVKFLSDSGSGETIDAIAAIDYAMKRGAQVMSNSWGGGDKEQSLEDAIKAAEAAGITFVAAAGNEYSNNDKVASFPANYEVGNVISVGAFTSSGGRASFSNYGAKSVHVFAPGTNIYSTINRGKYDSMSGTSMATPHVSGIIGLMLSKEPNLKPSEIRERLIRTSNQTNALKEYSQSNGRVDAYRALMNQ